MKATFAKSQVLRTLQAQAKMVATAIWLTGEGPAMRDMRWGTKASSE